MAMLGLHSFTNQIGTREDFIEMKGKKRKLSLLALCVALSMALLAACSSNKPAASNEPPASSTPAASASSETPAESPAVKYPDSFTYWAPADPNVLAVMSNLGDATVYKELEKITGTKVTFQHPTGSASDIQQQFNLLLASGNMPDVIEFNWLANSPQGPEKAIEDGYILRLNDLIDEYAPNFKKYLEENPEIAKTIKTDNGSIYGFPFIRGDIKLAISYGAMMRKDWLDKLSLDPPTTIEEWEQVLTAFRDQDPNGNNKKDEIPFLLNYSHVKHPSYNNLIGAWGIAAEFYQVDGKVKYGMLQPEFKEFIETMHRWYEAGLIDHDFAITNRELQDARVTNHELGTVHSWAGSGLGAYMDLMKNDPDFELVGVQPPTLNKGEISPLAQVANMVNATYIAAVTTKAKHPEEIVRWLDYAYGPEGHMLFNFGVEGLTYNMVDGYPTYTDLIMKNPNGLPVSQAMASHFRASWGGPFVQDVRYYEQYASSEEQQAAIANWSKAKNDIAMPMITQNADESQRLASIMNEVNTYADEIAIKMIMGAEPTENFDKFTETLKKLKLEEAIAIKQAALDRFNSR